MTFVPLWKQPEADNVNFHFITFVNVNDQVHELGRLALALLSNMPYYSLSTNDVWLAQYV